MRPEKSSATRSPAAPIAMSVWPSRQARPAVSVTMTPTVAPVSSCSRARRARALASGSRGSSTIEPASTLDASTPAAAIVSPSRVRTISVGPRRATTRTVSSAIASSRSPERTRPSALLITLLVTTTMSPSPSVVEPGDQRSEVGPGGDFGKPVGRGDLEACHDVTSSMAAAAIAAVASRSVIIRGTATHGDPGGLDRRDVVGVGSSTSQPSSTPPADRAP